MRLKNLRMMVVFVVQVQILLVQVLQNVLQMIVSLVEWHLDHNEVKNCHSRYQTPFDVSLIVVEELIEKMKMKMKMKKMKMMKKMNLN